MASILRCCPKCSKCFRKRGPFVRHYRSKHMSKVVKWEAPKE